MNRHLLIGGTGILLALVLVMAGFQARAADAYTFLVRVIVTEVNTAANTVTGYATHTSSNAKEDLAGVVQDYNVNGAKFYKWTGGKKKIISQRNVVVGDEVVMRGAKKSSGQFNVSWLVINDTSFEAKGKAKAVTLNTGSTDTGRIRLLIGNFTEGGLAKTGLTDKEVTFYVDGTTTVKSLGKDIVLEDIPADNQLVKITGKRVNGWKYEAKSVFDNVK